MAKWAGSFGGGGSLKPRQKREELPDAVAQGQAEQTDYEKYLAENKPVVEEPKVTEDGSAIAGLGRAVGKTKDMGGVGGFITNLATAPFRGSERLALEFLDLVGYGTDEQIENAREQLNLGSGNVLLDPDVIDLGLTVGTAGVGKLVKGGMKFGKSFLGIKSVKALKLMPNLSRLARVGRKSKAAKTAFQVGDIPFIKAGAKLKAGDVVKAGEYIGKMSNTQKVNILNRGLNWVKANKVKAGIIGTLLGTNTMMFWGASDNLVTTQTMRVNEAVDAVRWTNLPKSYARDVINNARVKTNLALAFQIASQANPLVSLTGGITLIANTLSAKKAIEEQERYLELL